MTSSHYSRRYKATVINFFDRRTQYDTKATVERALPLLEGVSLQPGQRVLDVATGTGIVAIAAAQQVGPSGSVVGVDFSAGLLLQAQQKIDPLNLKNIELIKADAEQVSFDSQSFDAILCSSALVYFTNIPGMLKKWHQWLKPGGIVAFSGWSEQSYATPLIIEVCARYGIELFNINAPTGSLEKCASLLKNAGFENVNVKREQQGQFISTESAKRWDGSWFHPSHNPLEGQPPDMMETLIAAYADEVEKRAGKQEIWLEKEAFYAYAQKPSNRRHDHA